MATKTKTTNEASKATTEETTKTNEISLHQALNLNQRFSSEAVRTGSDSAPRWLSWMTGNSEAWSMNGKQALPPARGWIIDQPDEDAGLYPDDYELIDAMEVLIERGLATACLVSHNDKDTGKPRKVPSWALPVASLFVVCEGVPSRSEMNNDAATRWGVAYGWRPGSQGRSELTFYAFVKELMDAGYNGVFQCSFSSYCTDKALACLKSQEYVLNFADGLRTEAGETTASPFYAYSLPIKASSSTLTAGREQGKTKEIYFPVPAIPRLSRRSLEESTAYLAAQAITAEQAIIVESGNRVETTATWSVEKSKKIIAGRDSDAPIDDSPPLTDEDAPTSAIYPPF